MNRINVFTIGFTKKSAEVFFRKLIKAGVKRVIDIRLNNTSQLAGYTKKDDLGYFLRAVGCIEYLHRPDFAPTKEILEAYKKSKGDWPAYEDRFTALIAERRIEEKMNPDLLNQACLLCSEEKPAKCHRRLVAEYFQKKWGNVDIHHIE